MSGIQINEVNILDLIPQRAPFLMVDGLLAIDSSSATSVFRITDAHILVQDGRLQESGILENVAQTAAALQGFRMRDGDREIKKGYIGGIKNLEILSLPETGDLLTTEVHELHNVMNASILYGEVRIGAKKIASCEIKVFFPEQ